ncbi:MAG: AbrB/MazE/SpoVT family DNA-binding domain-containing protein [Dehalococcoidia bacterium]|nr:AbrB/MazE/SpoVT family DNA-binding domain-containing protein [Dehalococcoidia bacterium]
MKELLTVVTRKGQITIPAEIRRSLGIMEGDKVALSLTDGEKPKVSLRPIRSVAELTFGAINARKRPEDFKELRRIFEDEMAARTMSKAPPADES